MPGRPLMFLAVPLVAVPIVWAFLLIGGGTAGPLTAPPAEHATSHLTPRGRSCDLPSSPCWQGIVLKLRPLEC
jgi:hypothetical protein